MNVTAIEILLPAAKFTPECEAKLVLEWFEVRKKKLTRVSSTGEQLLLQLETGQEWHEGDGLFAAGRHVASISIKPVLTICFAPLHITQAADFSYYIGNRHLPLFLGTNKSTYQVPYDGRLYEQLYAKFPTQVRLEEAVLISDNLVRR